MGNKTIESIEQAEFKESALPFASITADQAEDMEERHLHIHLSQLFKALAKTFPPPTTGSAGSAATTTAAASVTMANALAERNNLFSYLMSLTSSIEVRL